jgi:hypothetical protein
MINNTLAAEESLDDTIMNPPETKSSRKDEFSDVIIVVCHFY